MAAVADTPGGVAVLVARRVLAGPGLLRRPVPSAPGRGRAWRRGTSCWAPSGPAAARRPGSAGADRALLRRAERTPLAGRLPYTVPHAVLRFAPRPLAIPALRAVRGDPLRWISAQCAFRAAAAAPRRRGPLRGPAGTVPVKKCRPRAHTWPWWRGGTASGGGPYSQGVRLRGELRPGGWLGCGVAGGSPRPVGHPEGYPEPGGAARPSRFAVARARAWHPRRNPGTGEPARPTEGSPRPPGGAVADAARRGRRRWDGNSP
ncbi:hypothetical protein SALBM311S_10405 [Streptomyces alboniger]